MTKKKTSVNHVNDILGKLKDKLIMSSVDGQNYVPSIIEFCESKKYLNLSAQNIKLFPLQRIILKTFYRGQKGNEHIGLSEDELGLLYKYKLDEVLAKYRSGNLFRELVLVLGRRCVSEDAIISMANGTRCRIGSLWDNGVDKIDIISMDESDYKFYKTTAEIIDNGIQDIYKVTLCNGSSIEVTDNHPFLTVEGWKQCNELKAKDRIAVPLQVNMGYNSLISLEQARLLGYMIGDGCFSTGNTFFTCANSKILSDFTTCLHSISDNICIRKDIWTTAESKNIQYKITKQHSRHETFTDNNGNVKTRPSKNALAELLSTHELSGKTAKDKFVPECVMTGNLDIVANFLKALFSCDGSIYQKWSSRDNRSKTSISFTTVSQSLSQDVHHLLSRFGIISRVRSRQIKSNFGETLAFELNIDESHSIRLYMSQIGFVGKGNNITTEIVDPAVSNSLYRSIPKEIWKYIDCQKEDKNLKTDRELLGEKSYSNSRIRRNYAPNRHKITQINRVLQKDFLHKVTSDHVLWLSIKSIEHIGKKRTFDACVNDENRHNFIANDIILHNSGKDFMTALVALYELMLLLEIPGGSPFKYYDMAAGNPIYILTVATSSDQARILFNEMKTRIQSCEYFKDKIGKIEVDRIWFLTPEDKVINKQLIEEGFNPTPGSVVILTGHSNSESLLGKRIFTLLLDEVASFKNTGSATSGDRIYSALTPATADFKHPTKIKPNSISPDNPNGLPLMDSKIISISSPRSEEGVFYRMYKDAHEVEERLAFRQPTWNVNLKFSEPSLRTEFKLMSPAEFAMEFGAEFSGTGGELFIPAAYVDSAFALGGELGLSQRIAGRPGIVYYAHLDPAASSHNYALVVLHVEDRIRVRTNEQGIRVNEKIKLFVVDHIKAWQPGASTAISVNMVDEYIIELAKRFRFGMVSYDSWNSLSSVQKLRSKGIPSKMTQYNKSYKEHIYDHLEHVLINKQLALPPTGEWSQHLGEELKHLKKKYLGRGFKIVADPEAPISTDDLCDALAGACGIAIEISYAGYPKGGTVYMPQSRDTGEQRWKVGGGVYTGSQWQYMYRKFGFNPGLK